MSDEPDEMHVSGGCTCAVWWDGHDKYDPTGCPIHDPDRVDVRPISGGHPAVAVDAVYEFIVNEVGWDAGEAMRLQASDLLDALRAAGFGLVQLHQPNTTHHPWCNRLRGHVGPCQTGQTADQLDVSAVSGDRLRELLHEWVHGAGIPSDIDEAVRRVREATEGDR